MKNWLARLFGSGETAPAGQPPAAAPDSPGPASPAAEPASLPDYWHWLSAGAAAAPTPQAAMHVQLLLGELDRLIAAPHDAAGLVPRVPEVIPQLLRSLRDEAASGAELAHQLARDPALVAELIREANSPFYRAAAQVRTIDAALLVLGRNGLRMLLARAAFRPLVGTQGGRHTRQAAPRLWRHTERCALAASLLAPAMRADPFEAYLAGLMDRLGLIVALRLFDGMLEADALPRDAEPVAALLQRTRTLSARIALQWELPPPIAAAILGAGGAGPSGGQALAAALGQAERLALLAVLVEDGELAPDHPAIAGLESGPARILERLVRL